MRSHRQRARERARRRARRATEGRRRRALRAAARANLGRRAACRASTASRRRTRGARALLPRPTCRRSSSGRAAGRTPASRPSGSAAAMRALPCPSGPSVQYWRKPPAVPRERGRCSASAWAPALDAQASARASRSWQCWRKSQVYVARRAVHQLANKQLDEMVAIVGGGPALVGRVPHVPTCARHGRREQDLWHSGPAAHFGRDAVVPDGRAEIKLHPAVGERRLVLAKSVRQRHVDASQLSIRIRAC
mmetsp:Transcript_5528/g.17344  ORF Transcript_5528/g.17344 Transcript_5528/m.17344 type:complete len:249 (-) Transcript_5528:196-942(-)